MSLNKQIDFEIAKLLREKGFENESCNYYTKEGELLFDRYYPSWQRTKPDSYYDAPTIAETAMWLYEKHNIWIVVNITITDKWYFELFNLKEKRNAEINIGNNIIYFNSPTEAYVEAILHTLKQII